MKRRERDPPSSNDSGAAGWDVVHGELIIFPDPARDLPLIDRLEGFRPDGNALYRRVLVAVEVAEGIKPAWAYHMTGIGRGSLLVEEALEGRRSKGKAPASGKGIIGDGGRLGRKGGQSGEMALWGGDWRRSFPVILLYQENRGYLRVGEARPGVARDGTRLRSRPEGPEAAGMANWASAIDPSEFPDRASKATCHAETGQAEQGE